MQVAFIVVEPVEIMFTQGYVHEQQYVFTNTVAGPVQL